MVKDTSGFAVPAAVMVFLTVAFAVPLVLPGGFWPLLLLGVFVGLLLGAASYWVVERAYTGGRAA